MYLHDIQIHTNNMYMCTSIHLHTYAHTLHQHALACGVRLPPSKHKHNKHDT